MNFSVNKQLEEEELKHYRMAKMIALLVTLVCAILMFITDSRLVLNSLLAFTLGAIGFLFFKQYRLRQLIDMQISLTFIVISVVAILVMWLVA